MGAAPTKRTVAPLSRARTTNLVMVLCCGAALAVFPWRVPGCCGGCHRGDGLGLHHTGLGHRRLWIRRGKAAHRCGFVVRLQAGYGGAGRGFAAGIAVGNSGLRLRGQIGLWLRTGGLAVCGKGFPGATGGAASGGVTGAMMPAGVAGSGLRIKRSLSMMSAMPRTQTATRRIIITLFMPKRSLPKTWVETAARL